MSQDNENQKVEKEKQIISSVFNYFKNTRLAEGDKQGIEFLKDATTQIFTLEMEEMGKKFSPNNLETENDIILKLEINKDKKNTGGNFDQNFISDNSKNNSSTMPKITYNLYPYLNALRSTIPEIRITFGCTMLLKTVFHEIQHYRQFLMTQTNIGSNDSLIYARDFILGDEEYMDRDFYKTNYSNFAVEANANKTGYEQLQELIDDDNNDLSNLKNNEIFRKALGRYTASTKSVDVTGRNWYANNFLSERDNLSILILDYLIVKSGHTELLQKFPILQKEYNLDGTKKTAPDLYRNMFAEQQELLEINELTDEEREILLKSSKEMYFELIYRQLNKCTQEQLQEMNAEFGTDTFLKTIDEIKQYFNEQLNYKLKLSAQKFLNKPFKHNNNDVLKDDISVIINNKTEKIPLTQFPTLFDTEVLERELYNGTSVEKFLGSIYIQKLLPKSGFVYLKSGKKLSLKQYIEDFVLSRKDITGVQDFKTILEESTKSPDEVQHMEIVKRLNNIYGKKEEFLDNLHKQISTEELESKKEQQLPLSSVENAFSDVTKSDFSEIVNIFTKEYKNSKQNDEKNIQIK